MPCSSNPSKQSEHELPEQAEQPVGQSPQAAAPSEEFLPAGQDWQTAEEVAAVSAEYVPAGHNEQFVARSAE